MKSYETDYGINKNTAFFFIGGGYWVENFHGYIKDVKYFYDTALT